jgi:predicted PhzF superfamily epimerase YddE/YHI9
MKLKIFKLDAFTDKLFKGNPAAVVVLDDWLPKETMQQIALENNLAETAFFVKKGEDFELKWFTPTVEVDLCGHATLATAYVLFYELGYEKDIIAFYTNSGVLKVSRNGDLLALNFPTAFSDEVSMPDGIIMGLGGVYPTETYRFKDDLMLVFDSQEEIEQIKPDFAVLKKVPARGIIVTAKGTDVDFVSRFFAPASGIDEDPVTGSSHTKLIPYWAEIFTKTEMIARQLSVRGGTLYCKHLGPRVEIAGKVKLYLRGEIEID